MRAGMTRGRLLILAGLAAAACEQQETPVRDGGEDLAPADTPAPPSDPPVSLAVDFAVENCPSFDPAALTCTGHVPLTIRFVPLATATVTKYLWDFGDLSSASEATPSHTYTTPGTYTVKIIATGAGGGVVTRAHAGFIVAEANGPGEACDTSTQCKPSLFCLCPAGAGCSNGLAHGICAASCPYGLCGSGQVCAGLSTPTVPPASPEPWQTDLCLLTCKSDADCPADLGCRTLPPGPDGIGWVHGCFAHVPVDIGEPCTDSSGNLRDDLCASGTCADLGALGMCSMDCETTSCPPGSDCALLGDGRKLCLRPCTGGFGCASDSLLTCLAPGPGDLGYHLTNPDDPEAASSYCAPKPCAADDACFPAGICATATGSGHCVRR
jgi:PKD repeat protein